MAKNVKNALNLLEEAEKILNTPETFLGGLFGKQPKQYEALQRYGQASVLFKQDNMWSEAGNTFMKMAQLHESLGNKHDCAANYVNAANCFKQCNPNEAVNTFVKAVNVYVALKRFAIAGKHHHLIAEIYEKDLSDHNKAQSHYQQAVEYLKGDKNCEDARKSLQKLQEYKLNIANSTRARKTISNLSKEEVAFVEECFQKADLNGDGHASADELKKCFQDIDEEIIDYYIRLSDINMNGTVELEEAKEMYALLTYKTEPSQDLIRQMFLGLDKNKDGTISACELQIFCKLFKPKESDEMSFSELLIKLDANKDGKVDYNEFVKNYCHFE